MPRRRNISTKQIHADHWDAHEAVVIRSLNTDDEEHIQDEVAGLDAKGNARLYAGRMRRLTLQRAIVSWTLTDEHGNPLPLTEESIRELAGEDTQFIYDEINAHNVPISPAEKKASPTSATPGTVAVAAASHKQ